MAIPTTLFSRAIVTQVDNEVLKALKFRTIHENIHIYIYIYTMTMEMWFYYTWKADEEEKQTRESEI